MTRLFTRKDIESRNRKENAAIIIDNVVYDVSKFIEDHPGGMEVLMDNAGKDASRCFRDVGHSEDAKLWRGEFKIGEIEKEEHWEVLTVDATASEGEVEWTLSGFLEVMVPPVGLATVAILTYMYLL